MEQFFTPEQLALRAQAAEVANKYVSKIANQMDETDEYPAELVEKFGELGLIQVSVPLEYGGIGGGVTEACIVREEIAKVSAAASLFASECTGGGVLPLTMFGTEEQKQKYLPLLGTGKYLTCLGITEPGAGSDVGAIKTRAVRDGDHYVINGNKHFITFGNVASFCLLIAKTGPDAAKHKALSAFFVETNSPGFVIGNKERKAGIFGVPDVEIHLENLRVPVANRIGEEGDGFRVVMEVLNKNRATVAAVGVGIAQGAADYALNYCKEREQFGRPVIKFQGLQFMFADMYMQIEAARSLTYRAAAMLDANSPDSERYSAMAKCFATDVAMKVTTDAVQALGGYGYMKEYPVERFMRDAKITQIFEGTNQIQRIVMMRHI